MGFARDRASTLRGINSGAAIRLQELLGMQLFLFTTWHID